ncbi:condensation domain-containing protein [Streptomyces sp. NPDC015171]|uniref:condensation domain-containing protein n=1 Tax=Streptomyces sp. NPDC015171 TaxID=3364945 RepID=UPI003701C123
MHEKESFLTWGQQVSWWGHFSTPHSGRSQYNLVRAIRPSRTIETSRAKRLLAEMTRRYEVLRTTFHPAQHVSPASSFGTFSRRYLIERTVRSDQQAQAAGSALWNKLGNHIFDIEQDFPAKFGIVSVGSDLFGLIACVHHIALDAYGLASFEREFNALVEGALDGQEHSFPIPATSPSCIASRESSPAVVAVNESALDHWRRLATEMPPRIYHREPSRTPIGDHPAVVRSLESSSLDSAIRGIASQTRTLYPVVLISAFSTALSIHSGHARIPLGVQLANRHFSDLAAARSSVTQKSAWLTDFTTDPTFTEIVRHTHRELMQAMKHGRYSHFDHLRLLHEVSFTRGVRLWRGRGHMVQVNYVDDTGDGPDLWSHSWDLGKTVRERQKVQLGGEITLEAQRRRGTLHLSLISEDAGPRATHLTDLLDGVAAVLLHVRSEGDLRFSEIAKNAGIKQIPRDGLVHVDGSWVSPRAVRKLMLQIPGVTEALVSCVDENGRMLLSASVWVTRPIDTIEIRRRLLELFQYYPSGVCPQRITMIRSAPPSPPASPAGGVELPLPTAGTPQDFADIIKQITGLDTVTLDASYLQLGGPLELIPALVSRLRQLGWCRLSVQDLAGHHSLRMLAAERRSERVSS